MLFGTLPAGSVHAYGARMPQLASTGHVHFMSRSRLRNETDMIRRMGEGRGGGLFRRNYHQGYLLRNSCVCYSVRACCWVCVLKIINDIRRRRLSLELLVACTRVNRVMSINLCTETMKPIYEGSKSDGSGMHRFIMYILIYSCSTLVLLPGINKPASRVVQRKPRSYLGRGRRFESKGLFPSNRQAENAQ